MAGGSSTKPGSVPGKNEKRPGSRGRSREAAGRTPPRPSPAEVAASQDRAAREAARKGLVASCPPGTIARRAHYRRARAAATPGPGASKRARARLVAPSCVPDPLAGKRRPGELGPGRAPRGLIGADGRRIVIKVEPGRLEKHGYAMHLSDRKRREALRKAVESEGASSWLSIFRRLVLLSTWNKRKSPERSARARADAEYLKAKFRPAGKGITQRRT